MADSKKQEKKKEEPKAPSLTEFNDRDKYSLVKTDLKNVAEQALESYQEKTEGRVIDYIALRLMSKHGIFVRTQGSGNIEVLMSGTEIDHKTNEEMKQRLEIGLSAECATKAKETTSINLRKRKSGMAKNFEVIKAAYEVSELTTEYAQEAGTNLQKEIDEEDRKFWSFTHEKGSKVSVSFDDGKEININDVVKLVTVARQVITEKLGAKLENVDILFFKVVESFVLADSDNNCKDSALPRVGFVIQAKTKEGNTAFGSIRGVGNLEVLRRYTNESEDKKKTLDIIKELAESVADEVLDLDRAQSSSILGSEVPVILSSKVTGVLIHEILGHPSEADIIVENKRSKTADVNLKSRIGGTVIENTKFNMVDTSEAFYKMGKYQVKNAFGAIPFDCHGTSKKTTNIVTEGVFTNPLTDRYHLNEVIDGINDSVKKDIEEHGLSCNSRTPDYKHVTQIRMTNTLLMPDDSGYKSIQDMAREIPKSKKGVYIKSCAGGWVNTDTGEFCIKGSLGYLIENGTITDKPLSDVTMMGSISKIGNKIKHIGASETIERTFTGHCGKRSRKDRDTAWVPVDGAGPALYIEDAAIGSVNIFSWMKASKEYIKQSMEVNNGQRSPEEFNIHEINQMATKPADQTNLCMICNMEIDDELKVLTDGMKTITTFQIGDKGKVKSTNNRFPGSTEMGYLERPEA